MKIAWISQYPINLIPDKYIRYDKSKIFHPSTWIYNLSNALADVDNLELHIITETCWIKKDYSFEYNNIKFHILRSPYAVPFTTKGIQGIYHFDLMTKYYFSFKKIYKEINIIKPDLIHSHGTENMNSYIASKLGYPYIITLQGIMGILKGINKEKRWHLIAKIEKETIAKSKYFISHADFCDEYIRRINIDAKIFRIDDITRKDFFLLERNVIPNRILFVGNGSKTKGLKELIIAFDKIIIENPDLKLVVVGIIDYEYKKYLLSLSNSNNAKENIIFKGYLNNQDLLAEFSKADIFVFPSYFETSPNVVMEAMAAGLPIISTNVGGIPDMIEDGVSGILVKPGNADELKDKILLLINYPELKEQLALNAKKSAKNRFTEKIVVEKILSAYKCVLENSK